MGSSVKFFIKNKTIFVKICINFGVENKSDTTRNPDKPEYEIN